MTFEQHIANETAFAADMASNWGFDTKGWFTASPEMIVDAAKYQWRMEHEILNDRGNVIGIGGYAL